MQENMDIHSLSKDEIKGVAAISIPEKELVNDPVFKIVMMLETSDYLNRLQANQFSIFTQKFHKSVSKTLKHFEGKTVKKDDNTYLVLFTAASNAVLCALKIQSDFKYITPKYGASSRSLNIGISINTPLNDNDLYAEEAMAAALRMCEIVLDQLVISDAVKVLYESENKHAYINKEQIRILKPQEEEFLKNLMEYTNKMQSTTEFKVSALSKALGCSSSQLYRKLRKLTGKSPNNFIREIRLQRALGLLHNRFGKVSEIASESGFKSPSYFAKCFMGKFGILPSKYAQQHNL